MHSGVKLPSELIDGAGGDAPLLGLEATPIKGIQYFMFKRGWFSFLVLISISMLNKHKLSRNFVSVVILNFMPSHRLVLMSSYDSISVLMEEFRLGVHS